VSRAAVEAALARLRDARRRLREVPASEVHEALARTLDAWSAPGSPLQKELAAALPAPTGFSPAVVREGLARGLAPYTGRALLDLVRDELGGDPDWDGFDVTATVLAGAIPLPAFVAIVAPLALRSPVLVKPAKHDPVTAALLARSLPALLAGCVEVVDFRRDDTEALDALCRAPCVAAMGSDAAVAALAARVGPAQRFAGSGHRFSLALLGPEAMRGEALARAADGLALDVALWDQLGCLSPVSVHAIGDARGVDRVAETLAVALSDIESRLPRGRIEPAIAAAISSARAEAEMRAATGGGVAVLASSGTQWTVVRERDAALRVTPLHRFVRVHPAADVDAALAAIAPRSRSLAGVALDGFGTATAALADRLLALGASRVCAPGTLQTPPLAWPRDGEPVLRRLARRAVE